MKSKPEVPEEEIRSYMDFDQLLKQRTYLIKNRSRMTRIITALVVTATLIVLSLVWINLRQPVSDRPIDAADNNILGKEATRVAESAEIYKQDSTAKKNLKDGGITQQIPVGKSIQAIDHKAGEFKKDERNETSQLADSKPTSIEYVYKEAEPVDGYPALYAYFNRELVYPAEVLRDSIQGVVTVSFTIGITGHPENIEIQESLGEPFDRETKRIIENMPLWHAATVNDKPVPSKLSLPLTFQIQKVKR